MDSRPGSLEEARIRRGIKFDGTINLGHVLTFAAGMLAGIGAWNGLDTRVVKLEEARKVQVDRDTAQDLTTRERYFDIAQSLNKIDNRLDRIGDRLNEVGKTKDQK